MRGVVPGLHSEKIGRHVGAQGMHFGPDVGDIGLDLRELGLRRQIVGDVGANAAQQFENEFFGFADLGEAL